MLLLTLCGDPLLHLEPKKAGGGPSHPQTPAVLGDLVQIWGGLGYNIGSAWISLSSPHCSHITLDQVCPSLGVPEVPTHLDILRVGMFVKAFCITLRLVLTTNGKGHPIEDPPCVGMEGEP